MFIGLDLGTSGVKTLALDESGEILGTASASYDLHHPHPGWSEQDPHDWWKGVQTATTKLLDQIDRSASDVRSLSLSGQMHGAVLLDENGSVLRNAILWNDTRNDRECDEMHEIIGKQRLIELTGNQALEGFTAPKILWVRNNEPDCYEQIDTVLLPKDYIVYRMTGKRTTEASDAAGTVLYDVENGQWSSEVIDALDLSPDILPDVVQSTDVVGSLTSEAAGKLGLPEETKVVAGGADNACSAVGNGIIREGSALVSVGTSGVVLAYSDEPRKDFEGGLHFFNHARPSAWYLMGVMLSATNSVNWFLEQFAQHETQQAEQSGSSVFDLFEERARDLDPGADGLLFLPYLSGERTPHQDANARGVFFGMDNTHTKAHFYRSILEGVGFGLRDAFELLQGIDVPIDEVRITGGGARSDLWCRIIASLLDNSVNRMETEEGPAFGAAVIAGTGEGTFPSLEQAADEFVQTTEQITPDPGYVKRYDELYPLFHNLYDSLEDDFQTLREVRDSS